MTFPEWFFIGINYYHSISSKLFKENHIPYKINNHTDAAYYKALLVSDNIPFREQFIS